MTAPLRPDELSPVEKLRELARRAEAGESLNELGPWLADVLRLYLKWAPRGMTLEAAFGLESGPGRLPWWRETKLAERDEAIRTLAESHYAHLGLRAAVEAITRDAARYMDGRWRFDRDRTEMPPEYAGTPREALWRAMHASGGRFPTSGRHLRRILSGGEDEP